MPNFFIKSPTATLDYSINWADSLEVGDKLTSSEWDVPLGLTIGIDDHEPVFNDTATMLWLSGGTLGVEYTIINTITTLNGITDTASIIVSIQNVDISDTLYKTNEELQQYILTRLGSPIQNIEITTDQLNNSINSALELFNEYHIDACETSYIELEILDNTAKQFQLNENIAMVNDIIRDYSESVNIFPDDVEPIAFVNGSFYPYYFNFDFVSVEIYRQRVGMVNATNANPIRFDFNENSHKLIIHAAEKGKYLLKVEETISSYDRILSDKWLRDYAVALAKKQWGTNLMKYDGANLPGGATFNYSMILSDAKEEIDKLEEDLLDRYNEPLTPIIA